MKSTYQVLFSLPDKFKDLPPATSAAFDVSVRRELLLTLTLSILLTRSKGVSVSDGVRIQFFCALFTRANLPDLRKWRYPDITILSMVSSGLQLGTWDWSDDRTRLDWRFGSSTPLYSYMETDSVTDSVTILVLWKRNELSFPIIWLLSVTSSSKHLILFWGCIWLFNIEYFNKMLL